MAHAYIFYIVIDKFDYQKKPDPIVLLVVDIGYEVDFYDTTLFLGQAISLWMESNKKLSFYCQEVIK